MIGGELAAIVETIEFQSKEELIAAIRKMRESTLNIQPIDRVVLCQMLDAALQQLFYVPEKGLLNYKNYARRKYER